MAVSDGRKIGKDGRCKTPVGNTVDAKTATFTNSIGNALLMGYWAEFPDAGPEGFRFRLQANFVLAR